MDDTTPTAARRPLSPAFVNLVAERNAWRTVAYAMATAIYTEQRAARDAVAQAFAFVRGGSVPGGVQSRDELDLDLDKPSAPPAATRTRRVRKVA